jgi:ADP-ribose diphosphatase
VASRARVVRSTRIYQGKAVILTVDEIVEPGGVAVRREVVHHPGSVVVLPRFSDGSLLLVRQYRHAAGRFLWELVAGTLEPGEKPARAARRELKEESGYRARRWKHLFNFFPSPGILDEKMRLFEARGLKLEKASPEPDERISVRRFSPAQLRRMLASGKIQDAKTLVGLLWILF